LVSTTRMVIFREKDLLVLRELTAVQLVTFFFITKSCSSHFCISFINPSFIFHPSISNFVWLHRLYIWGIYKHYIYKLIKVAAYMETLFWQVTRLSYYKSHWYSSPGCFKSQLMLFPMTYLHILNFFSLNNYILICMLRLQAL